MKKCLCYKCPRRFYCYTVQKVFSNPHLQALFEAHIGLGCTVEDALMNIKCFLENEFHTSDNDVGTLAVNVQNALRVIKGTRK